MIVKTEIVTPFFPSFFFIYNLDRMVSVKIDLSIIELPRSYPKHYRISYDTSNEIYKDSKNLFNKFDASTKFGCYISLKITMQSLLIIQTQMKETPW